MTQHGDKVEALIGGHGTRQESYSGSVSAIRNKLPRSAGGDVCPI